MKSLRRHWMKSDLTDGLLQGENSGHRFSSWGRPCHCCSMPSGDSGCSHHPLPPPVAYDSLRDVLSIRESAILSPTSAINGPPETTPLHTIDLYWLPATTCNTFGKRWSGEISPSMPGSVLSTAGIGSFRAAPFMIVLPVQRVRDIYVFWRKAAICFLFFRRG